MGNAPDNISMDDLSYSLVTVVGVPRHPRNLFAPLNTHVNALFLRAFEAPRHSVSHGRAPPSHLRAVKLRRVWNAHLLSPGGGTLRDHRLRRLNEGNIGALLPNLIAFASHNPLNCGR